MCAGSNNDVARTGIGRLFTAADRPHVACTLGATSPDSVVEELPRAINDASEWGFQKVLFEADTKRGSALCDEVASHLNSSVKSIWLVQMDVTSLSDVSWKGSGVRHVVLYDPAVCADTFLEYLRFCADRGMRRSKVLPAVRIGRRHLQYLSGMLETAQEEGFSTVLLWPRFGIEQWASQEEDKLSVESFEQLHSIAAPFGQSDKPLRVYVRPGILPTALLLDHPCNGYACCGEHCHGGRSGFPRRLVIDAEGKIWPETRHLTDEYSVGRIQNGGFGGLFHNWADVCRPFHKLCVRSYEEFVMHNPYFYTPLHELWAHMARISGGGQ